jgi:hypothetical protein
MFLEKYLNLRENISSEEIDGLKIKIILRENKYFLTTVHQVLAFHSS